MSNAITTNGAAQIVESVATFVGTRFEPLLLLLLLILSLASLTHLLTDSLAPFHSPDVTKTGLQEATMQFLDGEGEKSIVRKLDNFQHPRFNEMHSA